MNIPSEVFRAYDIRGVVDTQLSTDFAHALGCAIGTFVRRGGGSRMVVGRDHRPSGVALCQALAQGIATTGCKVIDIGVSPTPVGYWAIHQLKTDGGVQVTGSHNPPAYNGFKMTLLGKSIFGEDIISLRNLMVDKDFEQGEGNIVTQSLLDDYIHDVVRRSKRPGRPLKVVVDAGNGTGGITGVPVLRALGVNVVPLYCEPDGQFPNHHPDPTVESNLEDLKHAVAKHGADVGFAFDGDADRIGVIDKDGSVIWGDRLMILLARQVLAEVPGATIIGEVKCSTTLYDDIRAHGGVPLMWQTGHSLMKAKIEETGAPLAGEMSGHIFFAHRYYGFDDAVYAGCRLLEILGNGTASLGERLSDVPVMVATPELRIPCDDAKKFALVEKLRTAMIKEATALGYRVNDLDGVRIEWPDGWGLVRPSNTQPILVMRFEAKSQMRLNEIQKFVEGHVAQARLSAL